MALESATYISQLVATNPPGSDPLAQADDHLRMIKTVLQTQFPNLGAVAVAPTAVELNYVDGVTSAIQTQIDAKYDKSGGAITGNATISGTLGVTGATTLAAATGLTRATGDSTTNIATTAFVAATALAATLPGESAGTNLKPLVSNGAAGSAAFQALSLTAASAGVTGILPVANGGTGVGTLTGLVKGNGTGVFTSAAAGTDYQAVLVSATNIKTINGNSVLGAGDLTVGATPLATYSPAAASSLDIEPPFDVTYNRYRVEIDLTLSAAAAITMLAKIGGTYLTTATYQWVTNELNSGGSGGQSVGAATTSMSLTAGNADNASGGSVQITLIVTRPSSTAIRKVLSWTGGYVNNSGPNAVVIAGSGHNTGTAALTGIRLAPSSGTFSGTVRVYPMPN